MRTRMSVVLALMACVSGGRFAAAQTVRGRVIDAANKAPIMSVLAELRDLKGNLIVQTFTSPSGTFVLIAPPNQRYQLRLAAIGYARHAPLDVVLANDPVALSDVVLTAVAVTLPEIRAMAGKRACGKSELTPDTFGGLIDVARTSLQMMDATMRSAQLGFEMQIMTRYAAKGSGKDSSISADTTAGTLREWPVRSLSIDSLQLGGFQRVKTEAEGFGYQYYGPDMTVLVSDWFLDTHCFSLDKDRSKGDTVVIKYDPIGHPKYVDVSGTLVLDRSSLTMRTLTWELRDLPDGVPDRAAGGDMHFAERSNGLWVPTDWVIWAPLTKVSRTISRPVMLGSPPGQRGGSARPPASMTTISAPPAPLVQLVGRKEQRGRLTRIVPIGGI